MVHLAPREAVLGRGVDDREVELLVGGAEVDHQVEDLVDDLVRARLGAVDLVHDDDRLEAQLERLPEDEARLRHRPFGRVDDEKDGVDHVQDPLHLAAEVAVPRRVDDVHLRVAVVDRGVLREDRDPPLPLQLVRVHHALDDGLVHAKRPRLLQQAVDERRLPVVDVGDDRDVPESRHRARRLADGKKADQAADTTSTRALCPGLRASFSSVVRSGASRASASARYAAS